MSNFDAMMNWPAESMVSFSGTAERISDLPQERVQWRTPAR